MRTGRQIREELRERHPRLADALLATAGLAGLLAVLATIAVGVGLLLGAPGPADEAPTVDFGDEPAAVVANATKRLGYRDFTVEQWVRTVDYRDGGVSGSMVVRLAVESTRGQVRGRVQPANSFAVAGDRWVDSVFVADGAGWGRPRGATYWTRSPRAVDLTREALAFSNVSRDRLAAGNATVVENGSTYVVRVEPPDSSPAGVDRIRYVIARGDDPHLQMVRFVSERRFETTTRIVRVLDYREATAPRPADVPWTTVAEVRNRVVRGIGRLI